MAEEPKTKLERLKDYNNETEKELVKLREVEAERQKGKDNKILSGSSGGNIPVEQRDPDQEFADKLLAVDEAVA